MILLGGNKSKVTKDKNDENIPILGITKIVLVYSYIVNNGYQQDSRVLHTFIPNKQFGQLLDISPIKFIFLKTFRQKIK